MRRRNGTSNAPRAVAVRGDNRRGLGPVVLVRRRPVHPADVLADPEIHRQWVADIATGLWCASVVLDPAVIVIGGGMSAQGGRLLNPLTQALAQKASKSKRPPPAVRLGDPTGRTVLVGAAVMAREAERGSR